jgi:three-Cys-motif partner protein
VGRSSKSGLSGPKAPEGPLLFPVDAPPAPSTEPELKPLERPIWTEHKARLIERYLRFFVFVTKHGTYIDGFAGPQGEPEAWAAKLVLESEPRWLRHFYLFEVAARKVGQLRALRKGLAPRKRKEPQRTVGIYRGDFNERVGRLLRSGRIAEREATFCLLDQHTFECRWKTVEALARYKAGRKIELFYFLATGWLDRAFENQRDLRAISEWWGRDDWSLLRKMNRQDRVDAFVERFRGDLGYASVKPYPIWSREHGTGRVMYYMIHATDHPEAPALMHRAYQKAVEPIESDRQLELELGRLKMEDP